MSNLFLQNSAAAALQSGVIIQSTLHPEINSLYPVDDDSLNKLVFPALFAMTNSAFPGGATSRPVLDMNGITRTFTDAPTFVARCWGLANYVDQLKQIIDGISAATALPNQTVVIP